LSKYHKNFSKYLEKPSKYLSFFVKNKPILNYLGKNSQKFLAVVEVGEIKALRCYQHPPFLKIAALALLVMWNTFF